MGFNPKKKTPDASQNPILRRPDLIQISGFEKQVFSVRFAFANGVGKLHNPSVSAAPKKISGLRALLTRHAAALRYVCREVLPVILWTQKRPVLFSRLTGMGDIICTIPAARELMKRHPGATFIYNCHADFAAVPKLGGVAGRITSLPEIGVVGHWYGWLLAGFYHFTHGDDAPGQVAKEPMVAEFLRQFSLPVTEEHPALPVTAAGKEKALAVFAQKNLDPAALVLIHPGPSWPVKEWPRENWARLVAELRARGFTSIGQLGVGRYMNFGQMEVQPVPGAESLLDAFTVEECIAAIAQAKLLVGIDSGLLHIAAAVRTPAVGIWGSTSPKFFYAENVRKNFVVSDVACQGCYHRLPRLHWVTGCPHDIRCMKEISVDAVLRACLAKLAPADNVVDPPSKLAERFANFQRLTEPKRPPSMRGIRRIKSYAYRTKIFLGAFRHLKNWRQIRRQARQARRGISVPENPVLEFRDGLRIHMVAASHAGWDMLFREIFLDRCYQPAPDFVPRPGWTVVDLGANMGFFTCQAAAVPDVRVVSVEPLTPYREILLKNISENKFSRVTVVAGAICGEPGQTIPLTVWYNAAGELKTGQAPPDAAKVETIHAPGYTLPEVFALGKIDRCDLLKVDIEGAEYGLFEKITPELWSKISRVVMEVHKDATHSGREIVEILERNGFQVHLRDPDSATPLLWAARAAR